MKLQGLSIVFGLIVIPMILVLTYFINLQVDTIAIQTEYDTKLLDATHDAMMSFEINTANEDLSSVADSLRTIIDASNNIFMTTLATNHGLSNASKTRLEPYIPAILYTLYDGYYISSPTKTPEMAVNNSGQAVTVDALQSDGTKFSVPGLQYIGLNKYKYNPDDEITYSIPASIPPEDFGQLLYKLKDGNYTTKLTSAELEGTLTEGEKIKRETKNVLKSYMPYSAKYVSDAASGQEIDVTINYTLDNYITIVGNIGNVYYTKSGYLIKPSLVKSVKTSKGIDLLAYNENDAETIIKSLSNEPENPFGNAVTVTLLVDGEEIKITSGIEDNDSRNAVIYYTKAKLFSEWIYKNLGNLNSDGSTNSRGLREKNITEFFSTDMKGVSEKASEEIIHSFDKDEDIIFDANFDPEEDSSTFANHKYQVIRNSIQYNLNLAMSIYNENTSVEYQFNMPVISNDEWRKVISNISIVSFLQGMKCGLKTYNNYAIVSSTNNELAVIPDEIYFTNAEKFENVNTGTYTESKDASVYHRIDCPRLAEEIKFEADGSIKSSSYLTSFKSKEVKYDKIYDKSTAKYLYDHKALGCYTCIIDGNYIPENLNDHINTDDEKKDLYRIRAYYLALGKERQKVYKMNAIKLSEGYEVIYDVNPGKDGTPLNKQTSRTLNEIKKIDITFGIIVSDDFSVNTAKFKIKNNVWPEIEPVEYVLNTNQTKEQTITINVNTTNTNKIQYGNFEIKEEDVEPKELVQGDYNNQILKAIKCIKVTYK